MREKTARSTPHSRLDAPSDSGWNLLLMKFTPFLLLALLLTACVGPDGQMYPPGGGYVPPTPGPGLSPAPSPGPGGGYYPSEPPRYEPPTPTVPPSSDYLPHLRDEYRNGYDVGAKDRSYGYPRDHSRAYDRFGRGYESYFQEGYADGYDGRGLRH